MLIDSHIHLYDKKFAADFPRVLERARDAGVERLVCIADDLSTSRAAIQLARQHSFIYATVGIHPNNERRFGPGSIDEIRKLAANKRVVAIGEIGLDYHYPDFRKEPQAEAFLAQARLATELKLPMVIHCRDAYSALIEMMKREPAITARGVVHCYAGTTAEAEELVAMGFFLGVGGAITYPNAGPLRETIRKIGLEHVVCETDAPYLPPQKKRGRRNEPSYIKFAVAELAELLGYTYQDAARITTANTCRLYGLGQLTPAEIAYPIRRRMYINITNRCTNACCHCARTQDYILYGHYLKLEGEPPAADVLAALADTDRFPGPYEEYVICGLGEPTLRLDAVIEIAKALKARGARVRLNTNGHGNRIHSRNILPELAGLIDSVCVTMNGHNAASYNAISCPEVPKGAFDAMIDFTREAAKLIPDVRMKIVAMPGVDVEKCRKLAEDDLQVRFQVRPYRG